MSLHTATLERITDQAFDAETKLKEKEDALDLISERAEAMQSALEEYEASSKHTAAATDENGFRAAQVVQAKALGCLTAAVMDVVSTVRVYR